MPTNPLLGYPAESTAAVAAAEDWLHKQIASVVPATEAVPVYEKKLDEAAKPTAIYTSQIPPITAVLTANIDSANATYVPIFTLPISGTVAARFSAELYLYVSVNGYGKITATYDGGIVKDGNPSGFRMQCVCTEVGTGIVTNSAPVYEGEEFNINSPNSTEVFVKIEGSILPVAPGNLVIFFSQETEVGVSSVWKNSSAFLSEQ